MDHSKTLEAVQVDHSKTLEADIPIDTAALLAEGERAFQARPASLSGAGHSLEGGRTPA